MIRTIAISLVACAACALGIAVADPTVEQNGIKPREELATHIITGKITRIWKSGKKDGTFWNESYVAEVRVKSAERGEDIKEGELAYVRYARRKWQGGGRPPEGWLVGMEELPRDLLTYRIFIAKNAPDGSWLPNEDGGLNAVCPGGFELLGP